MTRETQFVPHEQKNKISYSRSCLGLFTLFCLLLFLKNADIATSSIKQGLLLCAKSLIPALFPFMVLAEMILAGNLFQSLLKKATLPLQKIFRLSSAGCGALLLGLLCGFPVGAKCVASAYGAGQISKKEAERVLAFSNVPSAAFLINAVGKNLLQSRSAGLLLYGSALLSALLTGLLLARSAKKKKEALPCQRNPLSLKNPPNGALLFTGAVSSATRSMLLICAYVVFFSALSGALGCIFEAFHLPPLLSALTVAFLEISGGMNQAALHPAPSSAISVCALAAGWSGLSVHCQVLSVCEGKGFSFGGYFAAKLLQGILCALLCILGSKLFLVNFSLP